MSMKRFHTLVRVGVVEVPLDPAFCGARVVVVGPVADRHVRTVVEVRAFDRRGTGGDPPDEVGAVPLPDRVQDARGRP